MDQGFLLSCALFLLFLCYGVSNLYIIVYLRVKEDCVVGTEGFISLFLGDIKNYKKMNEFFVASFMKNNDRILLNRTISIIHLASPLLIPFTLLIAIISIGFV